MLVQNAILLFKKFWKQGLLGVKNVMKCLKLKLLSTNFLAEKSTKFNTFCIRFCLTTFLFDLTKKFDIIYLYERKF